MVSITTRATKLLVFAGALFFLTPCAPAPTRDSFPATGTWRGPVTDDVLAAGTFELVLAQPGSDQVYRGTWTATYPSRGSGGSATAAATGQRLTVLLGCTGGSGPMSLSVDVTGLRMTGSYGPAQCGALTRGIVDLTRQ